MPNIVIKWMKEKVNGVKTNIYPITHLKAVSFSAFSWFTTIPFSH